MDLAFEELFAGVDRGNHGDAAGQERAAHNDGGNFFGICFIN